MADTSERPTTVPTAPMADLPRDEPYQPLSLLAVAGFVLATLYAFLVLLGGLVPVATQNPRLFGLLLVAAPLLGAQAGLLGKKKGGRRVAASAAVGLLVFLVLVGFGGLLAYAGTNPWLLLEGAGWLLVAVAVFLCWLARSRIAASEGTLSGGTLASWGLTLGLGAGLIYGLYLAANTFAIRAQAKETAEEFIRLIADKDDPESQLKAFTLMLPVRARPAVAGADLRREIEVMHNTTQDPAGRMPGPYSQFRTSQYVQLMRQGVDRFTFERIGQSEYDRGGYQVGLVYRVEVPTGTLMLQVGTQGVEVADATGTRRRWQVMPQGTRLEEYRPNAQAKLFEHGARIANDLVNEWLDRARRGDAVTAYIYTLPESERVRQLGAAATSSPALAGLTGVTLPGALGSTGEGKDAFAKGLAEYRTGKLVDTKTQDFFAASDQRGADTTRQQMIAAAKALYSTEGPPELDINLLGQPPRFVDVGNGSAYLFPARIITRPKGKDVPSFMIDCEVQVLAPPLGQTGNKDFRVGQLQLTRGQLTPQSPRGPGG